MKHRKWIAVSLDIALFTASCAAALGDIQLEGLNSLTGQSDLNNVRHLLRTLASSGMLNELGTGETPTTAMQEEMEAIYREMLARTELALKRNRELMERIVERLLEKEEIDFEEVQEIFLACGCELPEATEEERELPEGTGAQTELVPAEAKLPA